MTPEQEIEYWRQAAQTLQAELNKAYDEGWRDGARAQRAECADMGGEYGAEVRRAIAECDLVTP